MVVSGKETATNDNDIYIDDASFHLTGNVAPNAPTLRPEFRRYAECISVGC